MSGTIKHETREQILAAMEGHSWLTDAEVAQLSGIAQWGVRSALQGMVRAGSVRTKLRADRRRVWTRETVSAPVALAVANDVNEIRG